MPDETACFRMMSLLVRVERHVDVEEGEGHDQGEVHPDVEEACRLDELRTKFWKAWFGRMFDKTRDVEHELAKMIGMTPAWFTLSGCRWWPADERGHTRFAKVTDARWPGP